MSVRGVADDIRALVFDTFGTVVDWRTSLIAELARFGHERGLSADWTVLVDAWRAAYRPALDEVRTGKRPWTDLDTLHREALDQLLVGHGLEQISDADRDWMVRGWHRLEPWPDAVAGLSRLKRRFIIAPLSNGSVGLLVNMAKRAGLPWDTVLGSDIFRHYKPDAENYLGAAALLGLPPRAVLMVAAHNPDLHAARQYGLRTAFVLRPTEHGPGQTTNLAAEDKWDFVAASFEELAERLEV
jgi:2-haloacid dehalogenase